MTLPHVNSDDPIRFLVQFNMYIGLKTVLLYVTAHAKMSRLSANAITSYEP